MKVKKIHKIAILGAGVMGSQIAAHCANAGIPIILFDLASSEGSKNTVVKKALKMLEKLKPAPLAQQSTAQLIDPANYEQDLTRLREADLIIEAVAERMDIKKSVYDMVEQYIRKDAIFTTNTSGLSINELTKVLPESLKETFCGVHFFNPPRYMHLVEIIPSKHTDPLVMEQLETFLTTVLGKGVITAKDTPNFIANRIGVFSILCTIHHGAQFNIPFETIDALTGILIGRPKSATFRTADVVGLDTLAHTVNTMHNYLPNDPWHEYFKIPQWMQQLIKQKSLGQKSGRGVYTKKGRDILVLDIKTGDYRPLNAHIDEDVLKILQTPKTDTLSNLRNMTGSPQAQFLWSIFRDLFHYCAYQLEHIANNARDLDLAIRWGFGYQSGPFETWQSQNWQTITQMIQQDIKENKTMSQALLPQWALSIDGVHKTEGSYSPRQTSYQPRPNSPVYNRQIFPETLVSEQTDLGTTLFENDGLRLWHQNDGIAIASFKTKKHIISEDVLNGIHESINIAENDYKGLIIWQPQEPFTLGANLQPAAKAIADGKIDLVEKNVNFFQQTSQRIRFSNVPIIIATRGMTLGGGCEFCMHASGVVAAFETYIGLVEAGVGLLPAGGGLKEITRKVAKNSFTSDIYPLLEGYFKKVAMASVAGNAIEAKSWGLLKRNTDVVFHSNEILYVAKQKLLYMYYKGYRPPAPENHITVSGKPAIANLRTLLANLLEGHMISEHDYIVADRTAQVICGGMIDAKTTVSEQYLLDMERHHFMRLIQMPKTLERIKHTLKTGKPLRN